MTDYFQKSSFMCVSIITIFSQTLKHCCTKDSKNKIKYLNQNVKQTQINIIIKTIQISSKRDVKPGS